MFTALKATINDQNINIMQLFLLNVINFYFLHLQGKCFTRGWGTHHGDFITSVLGSCSGDCTRIVCSFRSGYFTYRDMGYTILLLRPSLLDLHSFSEGYINQFHFGINFWILMKSPFQLHQAFTPIYFTIPIPVNGLKCLFSILASVASEAMVP